MIGLADQERRLHVAQLQQGQFLQSCIDSVLMKHRPRQWEGYIHASRLDWTKEPHKQLEGSMNPGGASLDLLRYSRCGDIYHEDIQRALDVKFGPGTAWVEQHLQVDDISFRGTPDRVQFHTPAGNILFEFKSCNTFSRDKAGADTIIKRLTKCKILGDPLVISPVWNENEKEILKRLRVKENDVIAKHDHETQMFTYAWILKTYYNVDIDWYVLVYVRRDSYVTQEYVWHSSQAQEKITRAYYNYCEVLKCLRDLQARTNGSQQLIGSI